MTLSYEQLNQINRALDIYNFPNQISILRQLYAIRVLFSHQETRGKCRQIPPASDLRTRLSDMAYEIYTLPNNDQIVHELMDTAIEIGASLPVIETQRNLFRQYERMNVSESKPPVKDIYSLQAITEDSQNVHHTSINEHVKQVVRQIVADYPPHDSLWNVLKAELQKRIHSWRPTNLETLKFIKENFSTFTIQITLKSLLISLFLFITHQPEEQREQLYQRLNEELDEMRGKCSTGHLSRLVNVLQGFSDKYTIQIHPKHEIKSFVYYHLNKILQDAPEDVQEGMTEGTEVFRKFITNDSIQTYFESRFGTEHSEYISTCIREFSNINSSAP